METSIKPWKTKKCRVYNSFTWDSSKNNVAIIDKLNNKVQYKFKVINEINNNNLKIDLNNIIDRKIKIIFKKIKSENNESTQILLEEQYNIINTYLKLKNGKSNIGLLNTIKNEGDQDIRKTINTNETTGINQYSFEYMKQKENVLFDLIISVENLLFEKESSAKYKFLKKID